MSANDSARRLPAERILLTGGSGRLGRELQQLLPGIVAPPRAELDVTQPGTIAAALKRYRTEVLVHAAAYTDVAQAERERERCWAVNVAGTRHIVRAATDAGAFLIHISTDYVFAGTTGLYKEDDPVGPPRNYYALSKLVAEEIARLAPRHLVIRTSFRPREWPHPVAFTDMFTSQDYMDVIAPKIALAIAHCREIRFDTLHIATERKSMYDLAQRRRPDVRAGNKREAKVDLPNDISLDISRWQQLSQNWKLT
jgi:dTDP-4-dehydrorhamnose reductase